MKKNKINFILRGIKQKKYTSFIIFILNLTQAVTEIYLIRMNGFNF